MVRTYYFESKIIQTDRNGENINVILELQMSQLMRLWYLSHRRPAKVQASLRISPEPFRCSHTWSMEVDEGSDQKSDI